MRKEKGFIDVEHDSTKHYMVLGFRQFPIKDEDSERDNPYIFNSFSSAFRFMNKLYAFGKADIRKIEEQLCVVEIETIIPYGVNPDIPYGTEVTGYHRNPILMFLDKLLSRKIK